MSDRFRKRLEAKVRATNRVHAYVPKLREGLVQALTPFVGKKVFKQGGSLTAKVEQALEPLYKQEGSRDGHNGGGRPSFWRQQGQYRLAFGVRTSESIEGEEYGCLYAESTIYVGEVQGGVLVKFTDEERELRSDYTADEIEGKRKAAEEAREKAREAESACWPFGERDN